MKRSLKLSMKKNMKAFLVLIAVVTLLVTVSGAVIADGVDSRGPAPNSGDCYPDGSGMGDWLNGGPGPAPNSGDGYPDGSGF